MVRLAPDMEAELIKKDALEKAGYRPPKDDGPQNCRYCGEIGRHNPTCMSLQFRGRGRPRIGAYRPKPYEDGMKGLYKLRLEMGLTQYEMAEIMGVQQAEVSLYESGQRRPSLEKVERMAANLGLEAKDLI